MSAKMVCLLDQGAIAEQNIESNERILLNKSETSIPSDIMLIYGEVSIVLRDNDRNLAEKLFTTTEILEITNKEDSMLLKIRNNLDLLLIYIFGRRLAAH